jgi:hypothetical protein
MTESWCRGISPGQELQVKRAVESTCELCREYIPLSLLELHGFPPIRRKKNPSQKEREQHILVVCCNCHRHIHDLPVPEERLRALIGRRPFAQRREILQALGYVPKQYVPPENIDLSKVYDETVRNTSSRYYL